MLEIYIKPVKKTVTHNNTVLLSDIAEVVSDEPLAPDVQILTTSFTQKKYLLVSVTDIVRVIKRRFPEATVINLGEPDVLIEFSPPKRARKLLTHLKTAAVALVLLVGSATAIMSFYTDAQMSQVFKNMHYVITGERTETPRIIELPFCIGLAAGIIVFFNHSNNRIPSPIEVEMDAYDSEVTDALINSLAAKGSHNG